MKVYDKVIVEATGELLVISSMEGDVATAFSNDDYVKYNVDQLIEYPTDPMIVFLHETILELKERIEALEND